MARQPRLSLADHPHHVIQRGHNRQAIVRDDADRQRLLDLWIEHARAQRVAVHAWVIMDNHIHLLLTPEQAQGLPAMMQAVGRSYVRYFNQRHGRSGTLWEGRYRSNVIETERYLLACMAYIDLNPVRAGLVAQPRDYAWSSHRHCIGVQSDKLVTHHALFWALGNTPFAREAAYAALVEQGLAAVEQQRLTSSALSGWALGSDSFVRGLGEQTQRRLLPGKAGRPRKAAEPGHGT